jgi:hypothetical protein
MNLDFKFTWYCDGHLSPYLFINPYLVQNLTHISMNFYDHKDLGYYLLLAMSTTH